MIHEQTHPIHWLGQQQAVVKHIQGEYVMVRSLLLALLAGLPTLAANSQQGATPQAAPAQAGFAAWPHTLVRDGATVTCAQMGFPSFLT